jgi:hypothetical protein
VTYVFALAFSFLLPFLAGFKNHEPRIVDVLAKRLHDGLEICCQPVRGKLNAIRKAGGHIGNKHVSGHRIALANGPRRNQLGICIDCRPGPRIASTLGHTLGDVLLFAVAECPDLIDLKATAGEVPEGGILEFGTGRAEFHKAFIDGVPGDSGNPRRRAHRTAVYQVSNHFGSLFCGKLVRTGLGTKNAV